MDAEILHQQQLEQWCAASIRSLGHKPDACFRGQQLYVNDEARSFHAPHIQIQSNFDDEHSLRGLTDALSLRLKYSDQDLFKRFTPKEPLAHFLFDVCEQLRCESLIPENLPGQQRNVRLRFEQWAITSAQSAWSENDVSLLMFTVIVTLWSRINSCGIPELVEDTIEHTRWGVAETLGLTLRQLKATRHSQLKYAHCALKLCTQLESMISETLETNQRSSGVNKNLKALVQIKNPMEVSQDGELASGPILHLHNSLFADVTSGAAYTVFCKDYDETKNIRQIVREAQLRKFRSQLDQQTSFTGINLSKIAGQLKRDFVDPQHLEWEFPCEEGYLNSARIVRCLTSFNDPNLYKQEIRSHMANGLVSFVVDQSGSMREHKKWLIQFLELWLRALDLAGIASEVLSFTTLEWNGGKTQDRWRALGKPSNPGRMGSVRHIVYKSAEQNWRQARLNLAGLQRDDLYKESIDGEALVWAQQRQSTRLARRKAIVVISDGSPMESATLNTNSEDYLDTHLRFAANQIETKQQTHLCAFGLGLDMSRHFRFSAQVNPKQLINTQDFLKLASLLGAANNPPRFGDNNGT